MKPRACAGLCSYLEATSGTRSMACRRGKDNAEAQNQQRRAERQSLRERVGGGVASVANKGLAGSWSIFCLSESDVLKRFFALYHYCLAPQLAAQEGELGHFHRGLLSESATAADTAEGSSHVYSEIP